MHEVKYVYQPIKVSLSGSTLKILNTHFFQTTQSLEFGWSIHGDGYELGSGVLTVPPIDPQSSYEINWESGPWHSLLSANSAAEYFLTINGRLLHPTRWVESGHVISSTQVQLPAKKMAYTHVIEREDATFLGEIFEDTIRVSQKDLWDLTLNTLTGAFESWQVAGVPVMIKGIVPCFWRAPTDNDKGGGENSYLSRWKAAHLDKLTFVTESCSIDSVADNLVKIKVVYLGVSNALIKVDMTYTIYGSGDVIVDCDVTPNSELPPLPRVGVEFHLDKSIDVVNWYGRGPFECYPDRKEAAQVGIYQRSVRDMHVPYIVPGECSGRADVRWVTFQNKDGIGLYASVYGTSPFMQMNASFYSVQELDRATHNEDLVEGDTVEVHLDHKHMGIGGDDSWSPSVHEEYLIKPTPYSFSIRLCPITAASPASDIYKSQLRS
uniref:beta-galactosidase n=1 Tax=Kalanchoe fedtschenkoi TaxID=63787 RepID=A0A7N0VC89_KALFE